MMASVRGKPYRAARTTDCGLPPTPTQVVSGGRSTGGKTRMPSSGGRTVPFHLTGWPVRSASRSAAKIASFSSNRTS